MPGRRRDQRCSADDGRAGETSLRGLDPDETRRVDEEIEAVERARLGVVPAGAHAALTIP